MEDGAGAARQRRQRSARSETKLSSRLSTPTIAIPVRRVARPTATASRAALQARLQAARNARNAPHARRREPRFESGYTNLNVNLDVNPATHLNAAPCEGCRLLSRAKVR